MSSPSVDTDSYIYRSLKNTHADTGASVNTIITTQEFPVCQMHLNQSSSFILFVYCLKYRQEQVHLNSVIYKK